MTEAHEVARSLWRAFSEREREAIRALNDARIAVAIRVDAGIQMIDNIAEALWRLAQRKEKRT